MRMTRTLGASVFWAGAPFLSVSLVSLGCASEEPIETGKTSVARDSGAAGQKQASSDAVLPEGGAATSTANASSEHDADATGLDPEDSIPELGGGNATREDTPQDSVDASVECDEDCISDQTDMESPCGDGHAGACESSCDAGSCTDLDSADLDSTLPIECPALEDRKIVVVDAEIRQDTTWTCENLYLLSEIAYVVDGATLRISPGVELQGEYGAALVVTRGSKLEAEGTAELPIVFTSNVAPSERDSGDWGGVILLGAAPINAESGVSHWEGISPSEGSNLGIYGGEDSEHDCGHLKYVRIEYAGSLVGCLECELNALTLAGCGSSTWVDYLQVHTTQDDAIEFKGGAPTLRHVVLSDNKDDSLDWDSGYQGRMQFVVVRQGGAYYDNIIEADNNADSPDAEPRSMPLLYNLTLLGTGDDQGYGMLFRVGTWGQVYNTIVQGTGVAIDVRDPETVVGTETQPPLLTVEHSIFFSGQPPNGSYFPEELGDDDDDENFDEDQFFRSTTRNNRFDVDPELADPLNEATPNFLPRADGPAQVGAIKPPDDGFFDPDAQYIGAFEPGGKDWTRGWTRYQE